MFVVVSFCALLQKRNHAGVPWLVRWQFKLEATEVLKVTVKIEAEFSIGLESFFWEDEWGWAHYGALVCACVAAEASECE